LGIGKGRHPPHQKTTGDKGAITAECSDQKS
jgi:hypothetical protein